MSKTSFKAFCVEFYAAHVGKTGPEVYAAFKELAMEISSARHVPSDSANSRETP